MTASDNITLADLETWFSSARMQRYASTENPGAFYVWDNRLSKAYLEDVFNLEVLLRNFISQRLAQESFRALGTDKWYDVPEYFNFNQRFVVERDAVKGRIAAERRNVTIDSMTAGFGFGTWLYMFSKSLEPTVWKALRDVRNGGMLHYASRDRRAFQNKLRNIWRLRNRCAHHEHLFNIDLDTEAAFLNEYSEAIFWVAKQIDPQAEKWIRETSRVLSVRAQRPTSGKSQAGANGLTKTTRFSSERLHFRGIEASDAEQIVAWRSDPANYRNFLDPRPITIDEHLAWFARYLDDPMRYDFLIMDVEGNPVGTCGFSNITADSCEISYMVGAAEARGKGYATEAVRTLTEVAFRELGVDHVDARILSHNEASVQVARKCGFIEAESVYRVTCPDSRDVC